MLAAADSFDDDLPIESPEPISEAEISKDEPNKDHVAGNGKLMISITDAVSERETVKFMIQVNSDLPSYVESRGREFKVSRTHHEFSWLHSSLSDNPMYAGYLLPPKPQKPDFSMPSKKLHEINETEEKFPNEDVSIMKSELEAQYLAQFKKAVAAHEVFLQRICQHQTLRNDHDLRIFLSYDGELNVRSKNTKERLTGWLRKGELVFQAAFNDRVKDPDEFFEKHKVFINEYELRIDNGKRKSKDVAKEHAAISHEVVHILAEFKRMSISEAKNPEARKIALDRVLATVCRELPKVQKWEARMGSDTELKLIDLMRYYVAETESVKDLLLRRQKSLDDLDRKTRDFEAAKIKNKNVISCETRKKLAQENVDKLLTTGREELDLFNETRSESFLKNLEEHASLQAKHSRQKIAAFESMIKALEAAEGEL